MPQHFGGFGRLYTPDARDRSYPMRAFLRPTKLPSQRYYKLGAILPLDQGQTGTCVAHAWTAFLLASPLMCKNAPSPFDTYRGLILMDEYPDNDAEATLPNAQLQYGSSVRAGAKYLQSKGHIKSYVWAHTADEAAAWILSGKGTITLGTDWYWGMSDLRDGFARLDGGIAGGHAYNAVGYSRVKQAFRCLTSWGRDFGQKGKFWISHKDMNTLLKADGEACAAIEQLVAPVQS